jgi:2-polyprenyl-3-methyl-5-hydroxy-6-metoxy-1,4-benzoquinol methylase
MAKIRTVLDIGCGAGQMATLLRDKGIPHYIGIDFSPARIAYARKICPEYKFIEVDVFETSIFNTELYDAVLATEFLEHIEHDIELVARFRPGVIFLGTVPNFPSPAHVRHFKSKEEVILRYNPHFTSLKVEPFLENPEGRILYLIEGIKA